MTSLAAESREEAGRAGVAESFHAAVTPTLSLSSRMMRSAVFLPTPEILERAAASLRTTLLLKSGTLMPLRMARPILGPTPVTRCMRRRKRSRSSSVAKP